MNNSVESWISERTSIHQAATAGVWETAPEIDGVYAAKGAQSVVRKVGGRRIVTVDQTRRHEAEHDENAASIADAHNKFPRALSALEAAMEQIGFMETDAENHHNQGREDACKALLDYADTLRSVVQSELAKTAIPGTDPSNDPEGDA